MPVTHGVAGSSPVRTARNKSLWFIVNQRLFYFNPRGRDSVENDLRLPQNETFQVKDGMKVMRLWNEYKNKKDLKDFLSSLFFCGQWWIRTTEGESQLSYSQPHLATLVTALLSLLSDSNQRPRDYKSRALANWAKEAFIFYQYQSLSIAGAKVRIIF